MQSMNDDTARLRRYGAIIPRRSSVELPCRRSLIPTSRQRPLEPERPAPARLLDLWDENRRYPLTSAEEQIVELKRVDTGGTGFDLEHHL